MSSLVTFNASFWPRLALRASGFSPAPEQRLPKTSGARPRSGACMKPASVLADGAVDCEAEPLNSNGRAGDRVAAWGLKGHRPGFGLSAWIGFLGMGRCGHTRASRGLWTRCESLRPDGGA